MSKTVYAKPATTEQFIDMRENPVCSEGFIQMQSERPENGEWIAQPDGTWTEKTITPEQQADTERQWAMSELARTDRCKTDDYPLNGLTREELLAKINDYREKLRNPQRSNHPAFPDQSWRPQWPEGVKRPAV